MTKKIFTVTIKGNEKYWSIDCCLDDIYLHEWLQDGLNIKPSSNKTSFISSLGNKYYSVLFKGNHKKWEFNFWSNESFIEELENDGLEIRRILNIIPKWVVENRLTSLWIWLQDHHLVWMS